MADVFRSLRPERLLCQRVVGQPAVNLEAKEVAIITKFDETLSAFAEIPNAVVGIGPGHPTNANHSLEPAMKRLLQSLPFLANYQDYLRFLDRYACGGLFGDGLNEPFVQIYGLYQGVSEMIFETDVVPIDKDGFFTFADGYHQAFGITTYFGFAFDSTGTRMPGVYVKTTIDSRAAFGEYRPAYASFGAWMHRLVEDKGRFTDIFCSPKQHQYPDV